MKAASLIMKLFGISLIVLFLATGTAHAQKETWLTNDNIQAFMDESETIHKKPYADYLAFMEKATHKNYSARIMTTIHKGNEAPIQMPLELDRKTMIGSAREGYDSAQGATITQTIQDITISPDKKSATVKSTLTIVNQRLSGGDNMQSLLSDMTSTCIDEIVYTPMVGIQILKANYTSDMTIKQEQEL